MQSEIKMIGTMTSIRFYLPDEEGDITGMAFCLAYRDAKNAKNNKELCTCVGSMLCSVVPGFKSSVEQALNEIGIKPSFVSLPSHLAHHTTTPHHISIPSLDWPSILVMFGYCILLLFKLDFNDASFISNCICELQAKVRWDPNTKLDGIPFDVTQENAISTMLGSPELCETVKKFLMDNSNHANSQIRNVCEYLNSILTSKSKSLV